MAKIDNIVQQAKSERDDYYSDDSLYDIKSWGADLSFRELINQYEDDELVKPEIQRNYVWDKSEASRFIDSVLLGLPIPSIFLAKTDDERMLIVDGYQRIMTVHDYVKGVFSTDGKSFRLVKSPKINIRWRGKTFAELSDAEQRRIRNTTIHSIIFVQVDPAQDDTSLYQVFERINTGGRILMSQEIRNCIYQGRFNKLLIDINELPQWRSVYGLKKADPRMRDIEFILRFLAMNSRDFRTEQIHALSLKKSLNLFMKDHRNASVENLDRLRGTFETALSRTVDLFGEEAFHNVSAKYPDRLVAKFNPTIFDSIMLATSFHANANAPLPNHDMRARRLDLLRDKSYQDAIRIRTTNIKQIKSRISLALRFLFDLSYE